MPRTSVQTEPKQNPFITKSISKCLLTPCRQVGLSRKRKTPNSANSVITNDNLDLSDLKTIPVDANMITIDSINKSETNSARTNSTRAQKNIKKKTKVSKRLIVEDVESTFKVEKQVVDNYNSNNSSDKVLSEKGKNETKGSKSFMEDKTDFQSTPITKTVKQCDNKETFKDTVVCKDKTNTENSSEHSTNSSENIEIDDSFTTLKPSKNLKVYSNKKKVQKNSSEESDEIQIINKRKAIVIESDSDIEDVETTNIKKRQSNCESTAENLDFETFSINNSKRSFTDKSKKTKEKTKSIVIDKKLEDNIEPMNAEKIKPNKTLTNNSESKLSALHKPQSNSNEKRKKLKRCLSMKKSSEEECDKNKATDQIILRGSPIILNPIENLETVSDSNAVSLQEIQELEKSIKAKTKLVDELRQAEIYKKKHNIEELQNLTAQWKSGCIAALNDLLPHLKEHGNIDMATLLNNLKVPQKLVTLSENGELV